MSPDKLYAKIGSYIQCYTKINKSIRESTVFNTIFGLISERLCQNFISKNVTTHFSSLISIWDFSDIS